MLSLPEKVKLLTENSTLVYNNYEGSNPYSFRVNFNKYSQEEIKSLGFKNANGCVYFGENGAHGVEYTTLRDVDYEIYDKNVIYLLLAYAEANNIPVSDSLCKEVGYRKAVSVVTSTGLKKAIHKYCDISTIHLTQNTIDNLVMENIEGIVSYDYPEGMFIVVPPKDLEPEDIPQDLKILIKNAREQDITLIRLDRDAKECDGLPTYNWDELTLESFTWMIGICSSATDGVYLTTFKGTEDEVKEILMKEVEKDKANDLELWDHGTLSTDEIAWQDDSLYAYGCYHDYHIDYSAKKID